MLICSGNQTDPLPRTEYAPTITEHVFKLTHYPMGRRLVHKSAPVPSGIRTSQPQGITEAATVIKVRSLWQPDGPNILAMVERDDHAQWHDRS
jgi:hypothetical protein